MILSKKACGHKISSMIHIHVILGYTDSPWAVDLHYLIIVLVMCILMSRRGLVLKSSEYNNWTSDLFHI